MTRIRLPLCLVLAACGPTVSVDESDGGGATTSGGPATTEGRGPGSDSAGPSDGGTAPMTFDLPKPGLCLSLPEFTCPDGVDCEFADCGDPFSPFDENGCLRPGCPCVDGQVCFTPAEWGGCASSGVFCQQEDNGECLCGSDDDCGGSYCIPSELVPQAPCVWAGTEDDCAGANCTWVDGLAVVAMDGVCECLGQAGLCIPPGSKGPEPVVTSYYRLDLPEVAVSVGLALEPVPVGLGVCSGPGPVPACECVAEGAC